MNRGLCISAFLCVESIAGECSLLVASSVVIYKKYVAQEFGYYHLLSS